MDQNRRLIDKGDAKLAMDRPGLGEKMEKEDEKKRIKKTKVTNEVGRFTVDVATHKLARWRGRN